MLKRFLTAILLIAMTIVLAACGGEGNTTDTNEGTSQTNDETPELVFTVTGAVDAEYSGNASLFCDDGDGVFESFLELGNLGTNSLQLSIPTAVEEGTIAVIGSDDDGSNPGAATYVEYTDEDRTGYEMGSGELVLETMPTAAGDTFVGTLTAELSDEDGNTVTVEATFNTLAGTQSFDDCNGTDG